MKLLLLKLNFLFLFIFAFINVNAQIFNYEEYIPSFTGLQNDEFITINNNNQIMLFPDVNYNSTQVSMTNLLILDTNGKILTNELLGYFNSVADNNGYFVGQIDEDNDNYYFYCVSNKLYTYAMGSFSGKIIKNKNNGKLTYLNDTTQLICASSGFPEVLKNNNEILYNHYIEHYYGTTTNQYTFYVIPFIMSFDSDSVKFKKKIYYDSVLYNGFGICYSLCLKKFNNSIYSLNSLNNMNPNINDFSGKIILIKTDTNLNKIWQRADSIPNMYIANSGGFFNVKNKLILFGNTYKDLIEQHGFVVYETDTLGSYYKFNIIDTSKLSQLNSGITTNDGGFLLCGFANKPPQKYYLVKLDSNYNILWEKYWGPDSGNPVLTSILKDSNDNYYVMGRCDSDSTHFNIYFAKFRDIDTKVEDKINPKINDYVIYPNPVLSDANLILKTNYIGQIDYEIIDLLGNIKYKNSFNKENPNVEIISIKTDNLFNGEYFLKITEKSTGNSNILKLIKN